MASGFSLSIVLAVIASFAAKLHPASGDEPKVSTCEEVHCSAGQECFMKEELCKHPPCLKVPSCRPSCDVIRCGAGFICSEGKCSKTPPYVDKCSLMKCKEGFYCKDGKCVLNPTCEGVKCCPWEECYLEIVQCFVAPCPPIPTCRPIDKCALIRCSSGYKCIGGSCIEDPCAGFTCKPEEKCYLKEVQCVRAPCPPMPYCGPTLT